MTRVVFDRHSVTCELHDLTNEEGNPNERNRCQCITSYRWRKKSVLDILTNDEFKEFIIFCWTRKCTDHLDCGAWILCHCWQHWLISGFHIPYRYQIFQDYRIRQLRLTMPVKWRTLYTQHRRTLCQNPSISEVLCLVQWPAVLLLADKITGADPEFF